MSKSLSATRFWIANFFVTAIFIIVIYQIFQLTVLRRPALLDLASKQHDMSIDIPPFRGQILDRSEKEFAANLKVPSVYAIPRLMSDEDKTFAAEKLSKVLGLDKKFILKRLSRDKSFVWIKRRISFDEAEKVRKLEMPAFGIVKEFKRFYPQGDLLAQVLGFTDIDGNGLEGIELNMNHDLKGRPGRRVTKRDALGREIKAFEVRQTPALDGNNVTLTIDHYLQYLTERALDKAYKDWKAKGAMAIVMDPHTGEILAIANRPSFNPNLHQNSILESRRNRSITDMYEPGSIFKIVTASAALNENKVTGTTMFNCENGAWRYGSRTLHDVHPYGKLSFEEVIIKSSNIGTVKMAAMMKPDTLQSYIEGFGFGRRTGIDLPGEAPGFTRPPSQWSKTSPFNIPMGQEIMVTPLQMATAISIIANGGDWVRPYLISKVTDKNGVVLREKKPFVRKGVIRSEVAAEMRKVLVRVVEEGTGKKAIINGITVGGKTGTAQKVLPNGRGYSHSNFMSSFVGFAPADNPQFAMIVVLDDPKPLYYGGTVAAPVFKEVMEAALLNRGYIPTTAKKLESPAPKATTAPKYTEAIPQNQPILLRT